MVWRNQLSNKAGEQYVTGNNDFVSQKSLCTQNHWVILGFQS